MLHIIFDMQGIQRGDKGSDVECVTKYQAQAVDLVGRQFITEKTCLPVDTLWHRQQVQTAQYRSQQQDGAAQPSAGDGSEQGRDKKRHKRR